MKNENEVVVEVRTLKRFFNKKGQSYVISPLSRRRQYIEDTHCTITEIENPPHPDPGACKFDQLATGQDIELSSRSLCRKKPKKKR